MNIKLILKVLLVDKIHRHSMRRKRSMYVRPIFLQRDVHGESFLVRELQEDPEYHATYFR